MSSFATRARRTFRVSHPIDEEVRDARNAALGAKWFSLLCQPVAVVTLLVYSDTSLLYVDWESRRDVSVERVLLFFLLAATFNLVHFRIWGRDGGRVTAADVATATGGHDNAAPVTPAGVPLRWCESCQHWQPLRSRHCDKCGYCVQRFDHHCFWVCGCVGVANHAHFYFLLCVGTVYMFVLSVVSFSCLAIDFHRSVWDIFVRNAIPLTVFIGSFALWAFVGSLLIMHTYLVITAQTTWEVLSRSRITYLKGLPSDVFPFDRGICANVYNFFVVDDRGTLWDVDISKVPKFNWIQNRFWTCC